MKKFTALLLALIFCVTLLAPAVAETDYASRAYEISEYISDFSLAYMNKDSDPLLDAFREVLKDDPVLFDKLVDAMFAKLDRYSAYMSSEEYDAAFSSSSYVGVGITIDSAYPYGIVVGSLAPDGSAEEKGIQPGDIMVTVDGKNVELMPYEEIVDLVRGDAGTTVVIEMRRKGTKGLLKFELERRALSTKNVTYKDAGNGVGVITVSRFGSIADFFDFMDIYNALPKQGIKSVIVDLRGNPGGDARVLYNMLDCIIGEEGLTLFELVNTEETETYTSTGSAEWKPDSLVVLINEHSASASEVFSGSLQKLGAAEIIGVTSYGKARSQYHIELSDGSIAIISAFEVKLPDGSSYEGVGIKPDIIVENAGDPFPLDTLNSLNTKSPLYKSNTYSANVYAMQQRLAALGILPAEPDGYFGDITLWAMNVFQKAEDIKVTSYATSATLKALENEVKELKVYSDTQMEFAVNRAKEATKTSIEALP